MNRHVLATATAIMTGLLALPVCASTQSPELKVGDAVATISRTPLRVRDETLSAVKPWRVLEAKYVHESGKWVWTSVDDDEGELSGWIKSEDLVRVPEKLLEFQPEKYTRAGHLGTPDAIALGAALYHANEGTRRAAAYRLYCMTSGAAPAVPAIIDALDDTDNSVREYTIGSLGRIGEPARDAVPKLIVALRDDSSSVVVVAVQALHRIGSPAVPSLVDALDQEDVRALAAVALVKSGPPAVPALLNLQSTAAPEIRTLADDILIRMGPTAVAELTKALDDSDPHKRRHVAFVLGEIGPKAVPALRTAVKDEHAEVRMLAVDALARIGADAVEALPELTGALRDKDERVRVVAVDALGAIGPDAKDAASALVAGLGDRIIRTRCADALGNIGAPAVPALLEILDHDDPHVGQAAIYALGAHVTSVKKTWKRKGK